MNKENNSIGLWKRISKAGSIYYSVKLGDGQFINLFKNTEGRERNPKAPHLNLVLPDYLLEAIEKQEQQLSGNDQQHAEQVYDDDIPF